MSRDSGYLFGATLYIEITAEIVDHTVLTSNYKATIYSPAAKTEIWQNISSCGEIMKLGTLVGDPCRIIFRLGPNSETPPAGRHLDCQYRRHCGHTFVYTFWTNASVNSVLAPTYSGSRNPVKSLVWTSDVGHIGFHCGRCIIPHTGTGVIFPRWFCKLSSNCQRNVLCRVGRYTLLTHFCHIVK